MQKRVLRITVIISMVLLFLLTVAVRAVEDTTTVDSLISSGNTTVAASNPTLGENENVVSNETVESEETVNTITNTVGNTVTSAEETETDAEPPISSTSRDNGNTTTTGVSTYTPQSTVQPTQSFSTVASIPEANLSLNNILNVILIAVGVIIILLAIAILIKLK